MSYPNDPYGNQQGPAGGSYGSQPAPPPYGSQPGGYGSQQPGYGSQQAGGYGSQQPGYGSQQPGGYGSQQPGYGSQAAYGQNQYAQSPYDQPAYQGQQMNYGPEPLGTTNPDDMTLPLYGATFGQAVRRFFKGYAKFSGRASRSEYWWAYLFQGLIVLVAMIPYFIGFFMIAGGAASAASSSYSSSGSSAGGGVAGTGVVLVFLGGILLLIVGLGLIVPQYAIGWRRMHDAGFAGPMYLLTLVAGIITVILACLPSKPEGMQYDEPGAGADPYAKPDSGLAGPQGYNQGQQGYGQGGYGQY